MMTTERMWSQRWKEGAQLDESKRVQKGQAIESVSCMFTHTEHFKGKSHSTADKLQILAVESHVFSQACFSCCSSVRQFELQYKGFKTLAPGFHTVSKNKLFHWHQRLKISSTGCWYWPGSLPLQFHKQAYLQAVPAISSHPLLMWTLMPMYWVERLINTSIEQ